MQYRSAIATDAPRSWLYAALVVAILAIADIIVNDFMPNKFELNYAYDFRHIIYMLLALISLSFSVSIVVTFGTTFIVSRLWLDGLVAATVAFLDIFSRHGGDSDTAIHIHPH
jgi:hypothetical protein